jgi:hypothetical protein
LKNPLLNRILRYAMSAIQERTGIRRFPADSVASLSIWSTPSTGM